MSNNDYPWFKEFDYLYINNTEEFLGREIK